MPIRQKVTVLNDFSSGSLERRTRTSASGKSKDRWSVTLDAKPLALDFDTKRLGKGPAEAIAAHLRARVAGISMDASASTQLKRKYAATAIAAGKTWANKRYAGGRIGAMAPNQSSRLFNDSGRFAKSIVAGATRDNNWVINVAANRLNATLLGGEGALVSLVNRLRVFVPEFGAAAEIVKVPSVRAAIADAVRSIVKPTAGSSKLRELTKELVKMTIQEITKGDS